MQLKQLTANFAALNKQIQEARAQMQAASRSLIDAAAQEMFSVAPEIERVFWAQYTPYFNDGESCTFSVGDFYFLLEGDDPDEFIEGSTLFSEQDYQDSLERLKQVRAYVADPNGWFDQLKREKNLPDNSRIDWHRPWPYTVERAEESVAEIELQRTVMSIADSTRIQEAFDSFVKSMQLIPDDIMETVYGDHVQVTITKQEGTTVEHYSHD